MGELFEEHEEILESLKSLPSKKRKRLIEDIYEESKKRKEEVDESDLLSESIDDGIYEDPKEDLAVATMASNVEEEVVEDPYIPAEDIVIEETIETEIEVPVISIETMLSSLQGTTTTESMLRSVEENGSIESMLASVEETTSTESLLTSAIQETFYEETLLATEDSLLTSTPSASKKASILFASWHNDDTTAPQQTQVPEFSHPVYQESNLDDLFDSYA